MEFEIGKRYYDESNKKSYTITEIREYILLAKNNETGRVHTIPIRYANEYFQKEIPFQEKKPEGTITMFNLNGSGNNVTINFDEFKKLVNDGDHFYSDEVLMTVFRILGFKVMSLVEVHRKCEEVEKNY